LWLYVQIFGQSSYCTGYIYKVKFINYGGFHYVVLAIPV